MIDMEDEDETDLFDDDEFDNLSESALQELEHQAILSTQQARPSYIKAQALPRAAPAPPATANAPQAQYIPNPAFPRHLLEEEDSFGFDLVGEEGVPTPVEEQDSFSFPRIQPSEVAQREQFRQQRYGQTYSGPVQRPANQQNYQQSSRPSSSYAANGRYDLTVPKQNGAQTTWQAATASQAGGDDGDVYQSRISELMRERDELTKELRATKDSVSIQKGEISIVRANFERESKVYDRQIGSLKKSMEEELAKHSAALNALTEKNNNLTTRYNFLQQEHNQELHETKTLRQRLKDRPTVERDNSPARTPRRGMGSSLRDGFYDDEIMLMSPSKSARKSKPATPTAANKRKRKAGEPSPIKPLVLRPSQTDMPPPANESEPVEKVVSVVRKDKLAERHLKFLQSILEYRVRESKKPLFETLVNFALPSAPSKTFSAVLLEGTARLKGPRLSGDLLQLFLDLWSKCLKEQYYKPLALLLEIVRYITDTNMEIFDPGIIINLTSLLQQSISINAEKRFKHSPVNHATYGKIRQTPQSVLNQEVDGTECLDLMLTMAYTISDDHELLTLFWQSIGPEFVLMMLNAWQPVSDITLMLHLLSTSIFSSTFGNICDQQTQVEHWIINRICYLLWETPKTDEGLPPYSPETLCHFRIEVMNLLTTIAISSQPYPHTNPAHHGSLLLANDASAIARLVRNLYDEVAQLYYLHRNTHTLHATLINAGVHLLHHLLTVHASTINLQEKLSVINGGVHKHRVVLTRLAFSEGWVVDREITDETVAMATVLLEESVTPDEADELVEGFPEFRGRANRREEEEEEQEQAREEGAMDLEGG